MDVAELVGLTKTAIRVSEGMASLAISSTRLAQISVKRKVNAGEILLPGLWRLVTRPKATGSPEMATMGMVEVASLGRLCAGRAVGHDDIDVHPYQLGCQLGKAVGIGPRPIDTRL